MEESERKAYEKGKAGDYHTTETIGEHFAYEQGKSEHAEEEHRRAEQQKNAPRMSEEFAKLMKIVVGQVKEMGVVNWRGYVGGVLIFFESLILLGMLLSRLGFGVLGVILGLFGGGFLFVLHKLPAVRRVALFAYPAVWVLTLAIGPASWGSKIVSILVCAAASFGVHYLLSLGIAAPKPEATVDLSGKNAS